MAEDHGASRREVELRQRVAVLKQELEQERNAKKQLHRDQVRELKMVQEKSQSEARKHLETVKLKLQREKNSELQSLRDNMTKEFKSQVKTQQKKHEEELQAVQREWKRERQELKDKLRREVEAEIKGELGGRHEAERKKLAQEVFAVDKQRRVAEERAADLEVADRRKAEAIRELETQHRSEQEKMQRAAWLSNKQQMEELDNLRRQLVQRDREMGQQAERLARSQAAHEHLEEEVRRMRRAESWARASPRTTSPTLSPSQSTEELAQPKQPYSKRERDMVIRNSELTFRVRALEEKAISLEAQNKQLQEKSEELESSRKPLEEQALKLKHRINELNVLLRSREKQLKQLSQENLDLKSSNQHLEEEYSRQRRSLQHQLSQSSTSRSERERLLTRNKELTSTNTGLKSQMEELVSANMSLRERLSSSSSPLPMSPLPLSPLPTTAEEFGSQLSLLSEGSSVFQEQLDQLEFEKDETKAKYEELKTEYKSVRERYKGLREKYERLQAKGKEQQTGLRQVQEACELLEREKLNLEREVSLLRVGRDGDYDLDRQRVLLEVTREQLQQAEQRVEELETFIIEQDEVAKKQEDSFLGEKLHLLQENHELQERLDLSSSALPNAGGEGTGTEGALRVAELEDSNSQLSRELQEAQKTISEQHTRLQEKEVEEGLGVAGSETLTQQIREAHQRIQVMEREGRELSERLEEQTREADYLRAQQDNEEDTQARVNVAWGLSSELQALMKGEQDPSMWRHQAAELVDQLEGVLQQVSGRGELTPTLLRRDSTGFDEPDVLPDRDTSTPVVTSDLQLVHKQQLQIQKLKEENKDLRSKLGGGAEVVGELQRMVEELEGRLLEEASLFREREEEIAQLTAERSQLESKVTRMRRAIAVGVNQQMSRELGHRVLSCINKTKEVAVAMDTSTLVRELQLLEEAVSELLQTVFPGDFEAPPPAPPTTKEDGGEEEEEEEEKPYTPPPSPTDSPHDQPPSPTASPPPVTTAPPPPLTTASPPPLTTAPPPPLTTAPIFEPLETAVANPAPTEPGVGVGAVSQPTEEEILPESPRSEGLSAGRDTRLFLVVMDYDPNSLCTTGLPQHELSLHTGAVIQVHGEMENAYYHATFDGQTGLVPANFVQELQVSDPGAQRRLTNQTLSRPLTPGRGGTPHTLTPTFSLNRTSPGPPAPPSDFHVESVMGGSVVLVGWRVPPLDSEGRSNGCQVTGYQVYCNEKEETFITGATQNKVLLAQLPLSQPLTLGIATCSKEGRKSDVVSTNYLQPLRIGRSPETEPYRTFVALYDYDPLKCSPSDNPEFELSFKEGSLVKVFGRELADGYLVGELSGERGLVPAAFVSEVRGPHSEEEPTPERELPATSKPMVAAFDYTPSDQSPNENSELELSFKAGDVITIYGNMDSDGFYCGELGGRFGFVPSNFLTEVPSQTEEPQERQQEEEEEEGGPTLEIELEEGEDDEGEGGREEQPPMEPEPTESPQYKGDKRRREKEEKRRGRGFSFGKDWVKTAFSRKRSDSAV